MGERIDPFAAGEMEPAEDLGELGLALGPFHAAGVEDVPGGEEAQGDQDVRADEFDLLFQVGAAGRDLVLPGPAELREYAFNKVGHVDLVTLHAGRVQEVVQHFAGGADEHAPFHILYLAGRLRDEQQPRLQAALAAQGVMPGLREAALDAGPYLVVEALRSGRVHMHGLSCLAPVTFPLIMIVDSMRSIGSIPTAIIVSAIPPSSHGAF